MIILTRSMLQNCQWMRSINVTSFGLMISILISLSIFSISILTQNNFCFLWPLSHSFYYPNFSMQRCIINVKAQTLFLGIQPNLSHLHLIQFPDMNSNRTAVLVINCGQFTEFFCWFLVPTLIGIWSCHRFY